MIFTIIEYANTFTFGGKKMSPRSIQRRCNIGLLPKYHKAEKRGHDWIIQVPDEIVNQNILKNFNIQISLKGQHST